MESNIFKIGDLVWAKLRGCPAWPGVVSKPPANASASKIRRGGVWVFFFGKKKCIWTKCCYVKDFFKYRKRFTTKIKHPQFMLALEELFQYHTEDTLTGNDSTTDQRQSASMDRTRSTDAQTREDGESSSMRPELLSRTVDVNFVSNSQKTRSVDATPSTSNASSSEEKMATNDESSVLRIGFLGLGKIGLSLARMLVSAGFDVSVWNDTLEKCEDICRDNSISLVLTPGALVQACNVIFSCLEDSDTVVDVLHRKDGVLDNLNSVKSYIETSSINTRVSSEIDDAITCRGSKYLEALVVGTAEDAANGQLVLFTSGNRFVYDQCKPIFEAIAKKCSYLGKAGIAPKMNGLLLNMMNIMASSINEALTLAERTGISSSTLRRILRASPLSSEFLLDALREPTPKSDT